MRRIMTRTVGLWAIFGCLVTQVSARQIGVNDFRNQMVFNFTELTSGMHLGPGYPNPYAALGVQFTGYVTSCDYESIHGNHLASGFANTPAEPYVVRLRFLNENATRVGAYVWAAGMGDTWVTAYDKNNLIIGSYAIPGYTCQFVGFDSSDSLISRVEWRGPTSSGFTTFPRVDGVMVDVVPEPATLGLLALGAVGLLLGRRDRAHTPS